MAEVEDTAVAPGSTDQPDAPGGAVDTSFRAALRRLDAAGRLVKVRQPVSAYDEVAGIMQARDGDRALLFEDVAGHETPVLGNFLASEANCAAAFGTDTEGIRTLTRRALTQQSPPVLADDPPAQQHVRTSGIDLAAQLPVLRHTPADGGPFITAGVVIVTDPATGVRNASYHRLQLVGPDRTGIRLDHGRHLRRVFERCQESGEPLPVAVCLGTDLSLLYAAAFMGSRMPFDADELDAAGGLRGGPLPMARGVSQDVLLAAESEIVLEGVLSPSETVHEGPFAEFVGYLSEAGPAPVLQVTALTQREAPVYHSISGAGRETIMLRKYVLEVSALEALRDAVPVVRDVEMTPGGLYRFHMVIQVAKTTRQHEGLQRNAILAAFGALKDLDRVIVVDDDIDIRDPVDVEYAVATRIEASRDLIVVPGTRSHEYVRVSEGGVRAKLGVDATVPLAERDRFQRAGFAGDTLQPDQASASPGAARVDWLRP